MFNPKTCCCLLNTVLVTCAFVQSEAAQAQSVPLLAIKSQHFARENRYLVVSGEVGNMASIPLKDVEAVSTFYDKNHNVIKVATALVEYNPIMPGQDSPFRTLTPDNPLVTREITTFKFLLGGKIEIGRYMDATERNYRRHLAGESEAERRKESETQTKKYNQLYTTYERHVFNRHDHLYDYLTPLTGFKPDGSFLLTMTKAFVRLPRQKQLQLETQIRNSCPGPNAFYFCAEDGNRVIDVVHKP